MIPAVHPAIPRAVWDDVQARLAAIEVANEVRLLFAIESGSRAWGFPSPDSDFDIRFVYVRKRDWYLRLRPGRDVIETRIEDEIDLNGWDVRKAFGLLLKSNAVIGEWIISPIRYRVPDPAVAKIAALADEVLDARALAHHYARLGRAAADRWLDADGPVPVKRYFYALRPALAIRCLRMNPRARPPMDLGGLVAAVDLPAELAEPIAALVAAKARTNEAESGARVEVLDAFIRDELARPGEVPGRPGPTPAHLERAERLFLELVNS